MFNLSLIEGGLVLIIWEFRIPTAVLYKKSAEYNISAHLDAVKYKQQHCYPVEAHGCVQFHKCVNQANKSHKHVAI